MPKLIELTKEEFYAVKSSPAKARAGRKKLSQREKTNRKYMRMLAPFQDGGYGELKLKKGETKQTEKNRLNRAAKDLKLKLVFKRVRGPIIRFEVKK